MKTTEKSKVKSNIAGVRKLHRATVAYLALVLLLVASTGIILGWKKNSMGYILPSSHHGISTDMSRWLSFDSLSTIAVAVLHDSVDPKLSTELNRIDARPDYGMVKFVFAHHYKGIQLDATTGKVLNIEQRRSDLVEDIHNGSYFDKLFGIKGEWIKLCYTTLTGVALLLFTITGVYIYLDSWQRRRSRKSGIRK